MSIEFKIEPYSSAGRCTFGMTRNEIKEILGEPVSTTDYGFPVSNGFLDDYGFYYIFSDNKGIFEAIEIFPTYVNDVIILIYGDVKIELSANIEKALIEFEKITDDMIEDEDGYSSEKLGVGLFCPEGEVENAIFYRKHYYD